MDKSYPDWESYRWGCNEGPFVSTFERLGGGDDRLEAWWSYVVFPHKKLNQYQAGFNDAINQRIVQFWDDAAAAGGTISVTRTPDNKLQLVLCDLQGDFELLTEIGTIVVRNGSPTWQSL
jgi:hypothetical protein